MTEGAVAGFREGRFTSQDGLRLFYRDYGDPAAPDVPLLCLPGLARNSRDFHPLAVRHSARRRVVCLDYRGRGRSDYAPEWRHYAATNDLNDVRHLLAATGLHRVVAIGTSYGGLLTMGLGIVAPRALVGAVLNDVGPELSPQGQERILLHLGEGRPQPDWATAIAHLKVLLPNLPFRTDAEWEDFARGTYVEEAGQLRVAWDTNIVRPLQHGGERPDLWALFRSLRNVPTLLLRAELTDILTEAVADRMASLHPHLARVTVPGVGHAPMLTEPDSVQAIDDFLHRLSALD